MAWYPFWYRRRPLYASLPRGTTLTVAERARLPIMGLRYGLPRYFFR